MNKLLTLLCFCLLANLLTAQDQEQLQDLQVDVIYLASDYLEGRLTGTKGEEMAAQYIVSRFKEAGLTPMGGEQGDWYQMFPFKEMTNPHVTNAAPAREGKGRNVIGYIDNQAETTIIIGAHYDHLGYGSIGSRYTGEPAIHNGADDNASGVAGMIRLAEQLKQSDAKNNNYLFIAFSGEEMGLFGSKHFVKNANIDLTKVNYMLNMDMIGRLNKDKTVIVSGTGTSPAWKPLLDRVKADLNLKTSSSGVGASDHTSFYLESIPSLHFFTGQHDDYHKPIDDSHLINYEGIYEVSELLMRMIKGLDAVGKIKFTKTEDNKERQAARFKVTLGVMPDYTFNGKGMRIDGVIDGRPASKADFKAGDVVIKIGEVDVEDIYGYMEGLSKFNKGDSTKVIVKRGDQELIKQVTF
ncbi:MAG: M20/M25/M40 family metallo-hydrolase [Bacteroidota bacterium]